MTNIELQVLCKNQQSCTYIVEYLTKLEFGNIIKTPDNPFDIIANKECVSYDIDKIKNALLDSKDVIQLSIEIT